MDDEQGVQADGCPYCRILHPGADPCSRCGGGTFRPARMLDEDGIRRAVAKAVDAYDGRRPSLDALLDLLFVHAPLSLRALEEDGRLTVERLRRDDATLP